MLVGFTNLLVLKADVLKLKKTDEHLINFWIWSQIRYWNLVRLCPCIFYIFVPKRILAENKQRTLFWIYKDHHLKKMTYQISGYENNVIMLVLLAIKHWWIVRKLKSISDNAYYSKKNKAKFLKTYFKSVSISFKMF